MSFCRNVCLQIGGNCARSPINNISFVSNGDVSIIDIVVLNVVPQQKVCC
jgi:hypothetical protein